MTKQQPEALRLAEMLTAKEWPGHVTIVSYARECVAELRRQHARIAELEAQLEAIGAGGVSGPLVGKPQAMPDLSALTERGAKEWAVVDAQGLRDGGASPSANAGEPSAHIKEPYTLAEIKAKIASNDYSAEMLLQHAMLLLDSASLSANAGEPRNAIGQATAAPAGGVVAYLDIGAGGYLDLGSDLSNEAISRLPKGRHALIIAGTYGIDGYTPTPPAQPAAQQDEALIRQLVDALGVATTPLVKDRQEVLRAISAGRARLDGKL